MYIRRREQSAPNTCLLLPTVLCERHCPSARQAVALEKAQIRKGSDLPQDRPPAPGAGPQPHLLLIPSTHPTGPGGLTCPSALSARHRPRSACPLSSSPDADQKPMLLPQKDRCSQAHQPDILSHSCPQRSLSPPLPPGSLTTSNLPPAASTAQRQWALGLPVSRALTGSGHLHPSFLLPFFVMSKDLPVC